ncbi:MAG: chemotaxis protein CheW [Aliidongia sp.]
MADNLDALWQEFASETQEHLETIERLLSDHHASDWRGDEVAQLFRSFHSLKGAFLAVGFVNLEAVAHRAEDILSLVRDGRAALDMAGTAVLLRAVDRLTDMRDRAVAQRQDVEAPDDILAELDRYQSVESAPPAEAPAAADAAPLTDDAEMLSLYCELLVERLPELASALGAAPEAREDAAESGEQLAVGAEILGFEKLAGDLQSLAALVRSGSADDSILALLDEILEQAGLIEEITGTPAGSVGLATALAPYRSGQGTRIEALAQALAEGNEGDIAAAASALRQHLTALGQPNGATLVLELEERFGRARPDAPAEPAWREGAAAIVAALSATAYELRDLTEAEAGPLRAAWLDTAERDTDTGGRRGGFALEPEVLAMLSPEQLDRLEAAHQDGDHHAYEILLELEGDVEVANDLLAWLAASIETITSRTVLRKGRSGFEFLILSPESIEWIRTQIAALDPEQDCLRDLREVGQAAAPPVQTGTVPAPAASPLIRVRSEAIDGLMTEIGEMRIGLAQLGETLRRGRLGGLLQDMRHFTDRLDRSAATEYGDRLDAIEEQLTLLRDLEAGISRAHRRIWRAGLELRVVPVETLFGRMSRPVRDLAQKLGKEVDLIFEGRDVRIDKSMVDALVDPLMHMLRNALDHGIETPEQRRNLGKPARAQLRLAAAEHADGIYIVIADDGRGLDRDRILGKAIERGLVSAADPAGLSDRDILGLIFRPGFSTAETVTDISGRGVGMDVVAATLQRLGGTCEVETQPGAGTRFILKLPVSAALLTALLFTVDGETLALPERQIAAVAEIEAGEIETTAGVPAIRHQGASVPLRNLGSLIGYASPKQTAEPIRIIIVSARAKLLALAVDQIQHFQDLFLKELHPLLARLPAVVGASELGDGMPVLVLDADALGQIAAQPL